MRASNRVASLNFESEGNAHPNALEAEILNSLQLERLCVLLFVVALTEALPCLRTPTNLPNLRHDASLEFTTDQLCLSALCFYASTHGKAALSERSCYHSFCQCTDAVAFGHAMGGHCIAREARRTPGLDSGTSCSPGAERNNGSVTGGQGSGRDKGEVSLR